MPSFTTHHIFSDLILDKLNKNIKNKINNSLDIYHVFAQSHDYLFYYTFGKKASSIKSLGHYAHRNDTQKYLLSIIRYIEDNNLQDNSEVLSYLYGSITHYVLDSTCHPFIFYKTGAYNKGNRESKKYNGGHTMMEKTIDAIMYEKYYHQKYNHSNLNKLINKPIFTKELLNTINYAYKKTYNKDNIAFYYIKAIKDTKKINTLIVHDLLGIKKILYKLIELLSFNNIKITYYSNHITKPNYNLLNSENNKWNHPCIKELTYNYSFDDLLNIALKKSINIIEQCNKYFNKEIDLQDLIDCIPNVSYSNGLLLEEYKVMRYFEN